MLHGDENDWGGLRIIQQQSWRDESGKNMLNTEERRKKKRSHEAKKRRHWISKIYKYYIQWNTIANNVLQDILPSSISLSHIQHPHSCALYTLAGAICVEWKTLLTISQRHGDSPSHRSTASHFLLPFSGLVVLFSSTMVSLSHAQDVVMASLPLDATQIRGDEYGKWLNGWIRTLFLNKWDYIIHLVEYDAVNKRNRRLFWQTALVAARAPFSGVRRSHWRKHDNEYDYGFRKCEREWIGMFCARTQRHQRLDKQII